jgi:Domain of unknown function (DUF4382)
MKAVHRKSSPGSSWKVILVRFLLTAASLILVSCSDFKINETLPTSGATKIKVVVSDPATCLSPNGPYSHVYLAIADVRANVSDTAGPGDSGWVDLTPTLSGAPMQVDLLGKPDANCLLATLGENPDVTPGIYKQFQVVLAASAATVVPNACGSSASCVVLASDSSVHALEVSDEATTGILRPIAGEGLKTVANQIKSLGINFLACESIVRDEQGNYRLRPVVNGGDLRFSSNSLRGKVLDGGTGQPVKGSVMIALEGPDGSGTDRVVWSTLAEADGSFIFCPLAFGAYDMVIVGTGSEGTFYEPSVLRYIPAGTKNIGSVKLYPITPASASFVTLAGKVTSLNMSRAGIVLDVKVSVLEKASNTQFFTIPMSPTSDQSAATENVATAPPSGALTCPGKTYCAAYSIQVPAGSINLSDFRTHGTRLSSNETLPTYVIEAAGSFPSTGGVLACNYLPFTTQPFTLSAGGVTVPVPTINIYNCP